MVMLLIVLLIVLLSLVIAADYDITTITTSGAVLSPRLQAGIVVVNDSLYLAGGQYGDGTLFKYNLISSSFTTMTPDASEANLVGSEAPTATYINGLIYFIGGMTSNRPALFNSYITVYDITFNKYSNLIYSGVWSARALHTATYINGKIYLIGGTNDGFNDDVITLDLQTKVTTKVNVNSMLARNGHTATVTGDGNIWIIGGAGPGGLLSDETVVKYDLSTNHYTPVITTGPFTSRAYHAAEYYNGFIYVVGGQEPSSLLKFDVSSQVWVAVRDTSIFFSGGSYCLYKNFIILIGGYSLPYFDRSNSVAKITLPAPPSTSPTASPSLSPTRVPSIAAAPIISKYHPRHPRRKPTSHTARRTSHSPSRKPTSKTSHSPSRKPTL